MSISSKVAKVYVMQKTNKNIVTILNCMIWIFDLCQFKKNMEYFSLMHLVRDKIATILMAIFWDVWT